MDDATKFRLLQQKLREIWPTITPRSLDARDRTVVVVHSISFWVPEHIYPLFPAYEERFLFFVLTALRQTSGRLIYVTSQPIHPRLINYFLGLVPGVDLEDVRRRLTFISLSDGSPQPLTEKILARPHVIERIRRSIPNPDRALIIPFNVSRLEMELAVQLKIPIYGPDPSLDTWGTKSGSRTIFEEQGVPHPIGVEGVSTVNECVDAITYILERKSEVAKVVVKLDRAVSGLGNATVSLEGADARSAIHRAVRTLQPEDQESDAESFLSALREQGGIVEELIAGNDFRSPSVQMRNSPGQEVEILSTHDQILGGPTGQKFLGCRFPADTAYGRLIAEEALKVGTRLAKEGVIGRYGIDFVVTRSDDGLWQPNAVEINLRNGGTTHPQLTLIALTDGSFDAQTGRFLAPSGQEKHYFATDHLEDPSFRRLTPEDLLDLAEDDRIAWDSDDQTGAAFHLVSAIAIAGLVGVTAIANDRVSAEQVYRRVSESLRREAARVSW